ncbi:MAG: enoyl-CoA hydratase/isomerase family protein [Burkholderiales bacterium]|nr:enoyl-CoA hydratase/isomerase family protein [Burkholderiales bacterium]MDE2394008.1 enoyl-CoA hydratase/isomerase family protein [Burkholderiales bacterium]MDE2453132.1 enoyl-CoA hydratase/isomerase family protein [Burkholderiales bacterium]
MTTISVERRAAVALVTIDNPTRKNAVTLEMRQALLEAFRGFAADDGVRAVVLTGAGDAFCSGADVGAMGGRGVAASRTRMQTMHAMIRAIHGLDKPVVAAVRGPAVGVGFSMAMACDLVVAGSSAKFAQVFKRIGLAPDGGAVWFLARQMGFSRAKELVFSARSVDAAEAAALGLVQRVVAEDQVLDAALEQAREYAEGPTLALAMAKQLFAASVSPSLDEYLAIELLVQPQLMQTADHAEGTAAFKEKRKPLFSGR